MGLTTASKTSTPQQLLWQKTYKDITSHNELDSQFEKLKLAVLQHLSLLQRQAQVRIRTWLKKLSEETSNVVWKKNRNSFSKLLLEQLRAGRLAEPFHQLPPDGPLPTLPKHAIYAFKPRKPSVQHTERLDASAALDDYLGRHGLAEQHQPDVYRRDVPAQQLLPGTRIQLVGAEARRVNWTQLNNVDWQPSKLELEAQLGASRERERELQWRLQQAEDALALQQEILLQRSMVGSLQHNSPSSLLEGCPIDDECVSPPDRRVGRKELTELIDKYEERRKHWQPPTWSKSFVKPEENGDEEEILEHLDHFQRQTEAVRRRLARRGINDPSVFTAPTDNDSYRQSPTLADKVTPARFGYPDEHGIVSQSSKPEELRTDSAARSMNSKVHVLTKGAIASARHADGNDLLSNMSQRSSSPKIRHTLKSAAAASKKGVQGSSPAWLQPSSTHPQQHHWREQNRAVQSRSNDDPAASVSSKQAVPEKTVIRSDLSPLSQPWPLSQSVADDNGDSAWREWQKFHGTCSAEQPQNKLELDSVSHLGSGASDLRQRLEQRLEEAAVEDRERRTCALLDSSSQGLRIDGEQSSLKLDRESWYTPSSQYRLSNASASRGQMISNYLGHNGSWDVSIVSDLGASYEASTDKFRLTDEDSHLSKKFKNHTLVAADSSFDDFKRDTETIKAQIAALRMPELV